KNLENLKTVMANSYDGALITPGSNLFYLTGLNPQNVLERLFLAIVYPQKEPILIVPELFVDEIERSPLDFEEVYIWDDTDDPFEYLFKALKDFEKNHGSLLIEDSMSADILMKIKKKIGDFSWDPLSLETSRFRKIKSEEETEYMSEAAKIADKTYERLLEENLIGKTEIEVAARIEYLLKKFGASGPSFETIVASGPNSANPHHFPTKRCLQEGDMVILDFGARYKGYCSDISRTIALGDHPEGAKEVYELVKKALTKAKEIVRVDLEAREIDKKAREIIEEGGYGDNFIHRVGHGLGLDAHEEPYLTGKNEEKIKKGMTFTIEPGIYLKGHFGVRIEDDIWVKNKKSISLTKSSRKMICLK
ncbi:MAG: aminopeptidase P family protein, partial [Thermoplasmatota archaeon]